MAYVPGNSARARAVRAAMDLCLARDHPGFCQCEDQGYLDTEVQECADRYYEVRKPDYVPPAPPEPPPEWPPPE